MDNDCYKLTLAVKLIYIHAGNPLDYPVRLCCTGSSHFEPSGQAEADVVVSQPTASQNSGKSGGLPSSVNTTADTAADKCVYDLDGRRVQVIEVILHLKCPQKLNSAKLVVPNHAALTINLACSIQNDFGRQCWRDGGAAYVCLSELIANRLMSEANSDISVFTFRKVYNSGYSVAKSDRLTGILGIGLGDIKRNDYQRWLSCTPKWTLHMICCNKPVIAQTTLDLNQNLPESAFLWVSKRLGMNTNAATLSTDNNNKNQCVNVTCGSAVFGKLFNFEVHDDQLLHQTHQVLCKRFNDLTMCGNNTNNTSESTQSKLRSHTHRNYEQLPLPTLNSYNYNDNGPYKVNTEVLATQACARDSFKQELAKNYSEYQRMLQDNLKIVEIMEKRAKNMRAPWAPMDTCVWEAFNDYSSSYFIPCGAREPQTPDNDEQGLIGYNTNSSFNVKSSKLGKVGSRFDNQATSTVYVNTEAFRHNTLGLKTCNQLSYCDSLLNRVGPHGRRDTVTGVFLKANTEMNRTLVEMSDLASLRNDAETQTYLPFMSYLMCQPLSVSACIWENLLRVLTERKAVTIEEYTALFQSSTYPKARKVADAAQMLCIYTQALEYITDYYLPRVVPYDVMSAGVDGRIEIEQFWNSLRSMCGDCDDLALGNAQIYRAFVVDSWVNPRINKVISEHAVLKEMRRLLACNYILFFNIEGVYLPRQKVSAGDGNSKFEGVNGSAAAGAPNYQRYGNYSPAMAWGNYEHDIKAMNSAHAAVKLLPKSYFERCVNRAYNSVGISPCPFSTAQKVTGGSMNCCFYHTHSADADNDACPVLCMEGTSMLMPFDEVPDPCTMNGFKTALFSDDVLSEVTKSPIYAKKAYSNFYKTSLFGITLDFLENHRMATFTYARRQLSPTAGAPFMRGVSHRQLAYKSEGAMLVPQGFPYSQLTDSKNQSKYTPSVGLIRPGSLCSSVNFGCREISDFIYHTCRNECKKRIRARKIKCQRLGPSISLSTVSDSTWMSDLDAVQKASDHPDFTKVRFTNTSAHDSYNVIRHDTRQPLHTGASLLIQWINDLKSSLQHINRYSTNKQSKNRLLLFMDNAYIIPNHLQLLKSVVLRGIQTEATDCRLHLLVDLETLSSDLILWRFTFIFS